MFIRFIDYCIQIVQYEIKPFIIKLITMFLNKALHLLHLITILSFLFLTNSTHLSISLGSYKTFCFNEDVPRHTLMKLDVSSNDRPFRVEMMYLRDVILNITSSQNLSKSITTQKFGIYRICLTNQAQHYNTLSFEFLTGVHAKDYATHEENQDYLKSIKSQATIAQVFINQLIQQNKEGLEIMSKNQALYNNYSIEYYFTVIFIGVIMLLSYAQFYVIKNHLMNRKYI